MRCVRVHLFSRVLACLVPSCRVSKHGAQAADPYLCRPATLQILREWRQLLTDDSSKYAASSRGQFQITDQLAFNMILERNISPIASTDDDWRVIHAMDNQLKLLPLPVLLFTTGHTFFYQHLPQLYGVNVRPSVSACNRYCALHGLKHAQ